MGYLDCLKSVHLGWSLSDRFKEIYVTKHNMEYFVQRDHERVHESGQFWEYLCIYLGIFTLITCNNIGRIRDDLKFMI